MKKFLLSLAAVALAGSAWADTFKLVSSIDEIGESADCLIVNTANNKAMGNTQNTNNRNSVEVKINNGEIIPGTDVAIVTLTKKGTEYSLNVINGVTGFLYAGSTSKNSLKTSSTSTATASISIGESDSHDATITFSNQTSRNILKFNSSNSPQIFACYTSGQDPVQLYKKVEEVSGPVDPTMSFEPNEIIVNLGSEFKAPELTCNSDGAVTYSSSDEAVATVNPETGVVTLIAKGTTTITATAAATDKFNEGTASYVIYVNLPLPGISFGEQKEYTVMYGESFTAPVLENPNGVEVTYDSTDTNVATVDAEGNVSIIGIGTTTIIASSEASDKYDYGHASYNLIVKDPNAVTFDFVNNTYGMTRYSSGSEYNTNPVNITEGIVTLTIDGGNNRLWSDGLRMYNKSKVTISVTTGYKITKVTYESTDNTKFTGTTEGLSYVISYTPTSSNKAIKTITVNFEEDIQSGVESVEFDNNAPKEYYNLQGVRIENPGKGLYIVRQGSKASKVIL